MISGMEKIPQSEHSFQLTSLWWLYGGCWCTWKTLCIEANINPLVPGSFVFKLPFCLDNLTCNKQSRQCYVFMW